MQVQEQVVEDDLMLIRDREERIRQLEVIFHNCAICLAFRLCHNVFDVTLIIFSIGQFVETDNITGKINEKMSKLLIKRNAKQIAQL
jgi:hypothetical protein